MKVQMGADPAIAPSKWEGYLSLAHAASMPPYDPPNAMTGEEAAPGRGVAPDRISDTNSA